MIEKELSKKVIIEEISDLKEKIASLVNSKSELLKIAQESFIIGNKEHLQSLTPDIREELGLQMVYLTQADPKLSKEYQERKNQYLSLGKSYASISFLFDLVEEKFSIIDIVLLQEILIGDGEFRKSDVYIVYPDGSKTIFEHQNIQNKIIKIFEWYYRLKEDETVSPVVLAVLFHYKLVTVHPFLDGNGRISRLVLNLILIKNGYFPVVIPNNKRKEYYESLVRADNGDYNPLVNYFAILIRDKLAQYLNIAQELNTIEETKKYLVLTEDGNTDMLAKMLEIHQISLDCVELESYEGKDNLASAIFFASKLLAKSPSLKKILIHRDRDNDNPQQIKQIIKKNLRSYGLEDMTEILVTKFYDIESYFLNERHINALYPELTIERSKELISQATIETSEVSRSKLRIAYAEYGQFGQITDPMQKAEQINDLYDSDPIKYRYGKSVLYKLEELIKRELELTEKVDLAQNSKHIRINEIERMKI